MRILVTRPKSRDNIILKKNLEEKFGISLDILELVKIKPIYRNLKKSISIIDNFDYLGFTSQNGVEIFFRYLLKRADSSSILQSFVKKSILAIGPKTAKKINEFIDVKVLVPEKYYTKSLESLIAKISENKKCLLLRSYFSIPINLQNVVEFYIYKLVPYLQNKKINNIDINRYTHVLLTSSYITKVFFSVFDNSFSGFFVPIGPTTYQTLVSYVDNTKIINYPENYTIENAIIKIIS